MITVELTILNGTPITLFIGDQHFTVVPTDQNHCKIHLGQITHELEESYDQVISQLARLLAAQSIVHGGRK